MTDTRNRRTQEEMLAHYQAQVDKLTAKIEGRYEDDGANDMVKALKKRLRKAETALRSAQITLNGVTKEDGNGWVRAPISEKIEGTEKRLNSQIEAKGFAEHMTASLPFDIDRLTALVAAAELGEDVEFPNDLVNLTVSKPGGDEQVEADFIATEEVS